MKLLEVDNCEQAWQAPSANVTGYYTYRTEHTAQLAIRSRPSVHQAR